MEDGRRKWRDIGSRGADSQWEAMLIQAYIETGRREDASALLETARAYVAETGEQLYVPELNRLEGEIELAFKNDPAAAEASFRRAVEGAARDGAKILELRAALRLGRLWRDQGEADEARRLLERILATFPQPFDSRDVQRATELLAG
jgi:predicted ATPase